MITEVEFAAINKEVIEGLNAVLDQIRNIQVSEYILLLADGEYKEQLLNSLQKLEPYVIDSREDFYMDDTRVKFFIEFLKTFYSFPKTKNNQVDDSDIRQHMELMIYSHVWESRPFLKRMYRMAILCSGGSYDWSVKVPPMGKHDFIRNEIRQRYQNNGFNLFQVIKNGYHSSLRNAFAHSEYSFDDQTKSIFLHNYGGEGWELNTISYNDWSKRFCYSVLLAYHLIKITQERRQNIVNELGTTMFQINHPRRNGDVLPTNIEYRPQHNSFNFR